MLMKLHKFSKWHLAVRVLPFVFLVIGAKYLIHLFDFEILGLSPLFTALISANIFLIGFLISGVLADYKESEKIPGDLANSIESLADECAIIVKNKKAPAAKKFFKEIDEFITSLIRWFHREERTRNIYDRLTSFNTSFLAFEPLTQANFIVRMKQEQNTIRRFITRIHTIRETSFNSSGYAIVELITVVLSLGLVFVKIDPFHESVFFIGFVTFVLVYMILLIHDLDNPFDYKKTATIDEISLKPLVDLQQRLKSKISSEKRTKGL